MAVRFGSSDPPSVKDPPSRSPFLPETDNPIASAISHSGTILLVEDNPIDAFVIREAFEECGLKLGLEVIKDGRSALSYIDTVDADATVPAPALVMLDLNLPKVSGIDVLKRLRTVSRCNKVPVVVITSSDYSGDLEAVERLGIAAYFQKPTALEGFMSLARVIVDVLANHDGQKSDSRSQKSEANEA